MAYFRTSFIDANIGDAENCTSIPSPVPVPTQTPSPVPVPTLIPSTVPVPTPTSSNVSECTCGKKKTSRIVGGTETEVWE